MKEPETKYEYSTKNVDIAAFLIVRGFRLLRGVCGEDDKISFFFEDNAAAEQVASEFYSGGQVPAREFADAARRIKDLVWEFRRKRNTERANGQTTR